MSLNDVISSDEFQNRFGVHTKPFQEFAAYILIMAREHTDLSVREVGAYVKNLMQEKHKLELDLAEADPNRLSNEHHDIHKLKADLKRLQEAHDRQYIMADKAREEARIAEANRAERDDAANSLAGRIADMKDEAKNLRSALNRFQNIARNTARVLRSLVDGIPPDIDIIEDGCIRLYLKQVLDRHQSRLDGVKLLVEERDSLKARS
jgi:hypothetical protein